MATPALTGLYGARPTFEVDGQLNVDLSEGLTSLLVEETTEGLTRCEAAFSNWGAGADGGFRYFDRQVLDFGKGLKIRAGEGDKEAQIFDGRITALEAVFAQLRAPQF